MPKMRYKIPSINASLSQKKLPQLIASGKMHNGNIFIYLNYDFSSEMESKAMLCWYELKLSRSATEGIESAYDLNCV